MSSSRERAKKIYDVDDKYDDADENHINLFVAARLARELLTVLCRVVSVCVVHVSPGGYG